MHGRNRRSAIFPLCVNRNEVRRNLEKIALCIRRHDPDIVTLQEVDQSSILSGEFNQCDFLASELQYPYKFCAPSCSFSICGKEIFVSGNAILSKYPLDHCESYRFNRSFPTDRMGFAIADITIPGGGMITVVSLHLVYLDWLRRLSRVRQLQLVERVVCSRRGKLVIAGDYNCDCTGKEESLRRFLNDLDLRTHAPEDRSIRTYPSWSPTKRIDWILTSRDVDILSYNTVHERLSDHLAVMATLSI